MRAACLVLLMGAGLALASPWGPGKARQPVGLEDPRPARIPVLSALGAVLSMKRLLRLLLIVCATALAATALLVLLERRFIFYPTREPAITWQPPVPDVAECTFATADGLRLHGWWHPGWGDEDPARRPVVLWCHGNAGNITHRAENLLLLADHGLAVLLFDYRGYGRSEGRPSEDGLYLDAEAAYEYLVHQRGVEPERVVCFGRSLGAAVALHLALERPVAGLVMESPFASIPAMARRQMPFLPAWLLVRTQFDNLDRVRDLRVPLLVVHGAQDELVPLAQGRAVYDAAPGPKEFYLIEGAGHNDTYVVGGERYFLALRRFCDRCLAHAPAGQGHLP